MEVQIITQGASLERQLRIKKKKIKDSITEKDEQLNENPILNVPKILKSNENSSSDEDELISFTSNYDFIKHKKNANITLNGFYYNEKPNQSEYLNESIDKSKLFLFIY